MIRDDIGITIIVSMIVGAVLLIVPFTIQVAG